jgi:glyoxylase-like metal-dependent hydrolase (beta-lactamase superfamily II)
VLDITVLDAGNPGPMTGSGNHTYLLASAGAAVLIDAGVGKPDHLLAIHNALGERNLTLTSVVVTHRHDDHIRGAPAIARAHPGCVFVKLMPAEDDAHAAVAWEGLHDRDVIRFGETAVRVLHTPGHSPDHAAFWHEQSGAIFSGDLVIAGGSVVLDAIPGSLTRYLHSLRLVLELNPSRLYPAHGPRIDEPAPVIHAHLQHRLERERQVIAAVEAGCRTVEAIADYIYDGLDPPLIPAARQNVRAHLDKLRTDGIAADRDGWRIL